MGPADPASGWPTQRFQTSLPLSVSPATHSVVTELGVVVTIAARLRAGRELDSPDEYRARGTQKRGGSFGERLIVGN
jgi:hypothetical protein